MQPHCTPHYSPSPHYNYNTNVHESHSPHMPSMKHKHQCWASCCQSLGKQSAQKRLPHWTNPSQHTCTSPDTQLQPRAHELAASPNHTHTYYTPPTRLLPHFSILHYSSLLAILLALQCWCQMLLCWSLDTLQSYIHNSLLLMCSTEWVVLVYASVCGPLLQFIWVTSRVISASLIVLNNDNWS